MVEDLDAAAAAYSVVVDTAAAEAEAVAMEQLQKGGCEDMVGVICVQ